jgi:hypothetical protein
LCHDYKKEDVMKKKFVVRLSAEEREGLECLVSTGAAAAKKLRRARVLLLVDQGECGPNLIDKEVAKIIGISVRSVEIIRQDLCEKGLAASIERKRYESKTRIRKIDGEVEAHLVALSCSSPPEGYEKWSLRMLADKVVEMNILDEVSHETIRRALKKMN